MTGIAADMRYPNVHIFAIEPQVFGHQVSDLRAINIPKNRFKRFKGRKFFDDIHTAYIAGMPNLVAAIKMFENGIIQVAVGIREKADFSHRFVEKDKEPVICLDDQTASKKYLFQRKKQGTRQM